jgi:hypothetical protein
MWGFLTANNIKAKIYKEGTVGISNFFETLTTSTLWTLSQQNPNCYFLNCEKKNLFQIKESERLSYVISLYLQNHVLYQISELVA